MSKTSKFAGVLAAHQLGPEPEPVSLPEAPAVEPSPAPSIANHFPALPSTSPSKLTARPRGKRSDPNFEQVTAYLPSELYGQVRAALFQSKPRGEFSVLMADLLIAWLESRPTK